MQTINPPGWRRPSGYSNGIVAQGRFLTIAGQIGWNDRQVLAEGFLEQTCQALRNIVEVLQAAGGRPEHLVRLTWYVTDKHKYRAKQREIGKAYREIIGEHYPAMTLVQVSGLLENGALVEIEASAVLPEQA